MNPTRPLALAEENRADVQGAVPALGYETVFSSREFAEAWSQASAGRERPLAIPVVGSGPPRTMYGVQTCYRLGLRSVSLGPQGFYASPGWEGELDTSTLRAILSGLKGARTVSVVWNVRFDQEPLAAGLASLGLRSRRSSAHVLDLRPGYDKLLAGFSATTRNHIRKAQRRGVRVRAGTGPEDLRAYYEIHRRLVDYKGGYHFLFPLEFLLRLLPMTGIAEFLIAEHEGRMIAGGLFLRDGCSVFYLHSAYERDHSNLFPACAVLDEAIRRACAGGAAFFNFGGSGGIASLERFKSSWGARVEQNWTFRWRNPLWGPIVGLTGALSRLKAAVRSHTPRPPGRPVEEQDAASGPEAGGED
jgi:hypothetical protein